MLNGISGGEVRPDGGSTVQPSHAPRYNMHIGVSVQAYLTNLSPTTWETLSVSFCTVGMAVRRQCMPSPETSSGEASQHTPAGTLLCGTTP